jgi:Rod binding domain-containing protein
MSEINYREYRLNELSRRFYQMTVRPAPDGKLDLQNSIKTGQHTPERTSRFTDEIRNLFPGLDEGKMPSSAFKLDRMPEPSSLTGEHRRLYETALEFQALFINMMLRGMRSTLNPENDMLYGGQRQEIFEDMLYEERAKSFSKYGGFPLAEQIYLQLAPMIQPEDAADSYENNLRRVPPTVSTDQIQREWKR